MKSLLTVTAILTIFQTVAAWGSLGHQTIAYLAQHYVSNHTQSWAQSILNDTSTSYLAKIATWADSYRYTSEGAFSAPFHYIDALDNPPETCNVDYERDCTEAGCIVSAIANYTQRVQAPSELDALQVSYALRWIVHFVGDISQPLHDENYELGGNGVDVTFDGEETNLHAAWDSSIPEELRGGYGLEEAAAWADDLASSISAGEYSAQKDSWLEGIDLADPIATGMVWARDGNSYVCTVVMPQGGEALNNTELYPSYYESAVSTVEMQIAKAGVRLAKWLDLIADGQKVEGEYRRDWAGSSKVDMRARDLTGWDLVPRGNGGRLARERRVRRALAGNGCGCTH